MTTNTSTTSPSVESTIDPDAVPTFEKGTWQDTLSKSTILLDRSKSARIKASTMLWTGAQDAIADWESKADTDVTGENLYNDVMAVLGKSRKGDASKIKTVALAAKTHSLVVGSYPNLSKAYKAALALTTQQTQQNAEDAALDKALAGITAPASTTTVEGAAAILLGKGTDGAVVAILDALGAQNFSAHRAFMRSLAKEIADRETAARQAAAAASAPKAGPKTGATQATGGAAAAKAKPTAATPGDGTAKGKPVQKGKPVKAAAAAPAEASDKGAPSTEKAAAPAKAEAPAAKVTGARAPIKRPAKV